MEPQNSFFGRMGLFNAPTLTPAHRLIGVAALLGGCFVVSHVVSWILTFAIAGLDVPAQAFLLDIAGFIAGAFFAVQCRASSSARSAERVRQNRWICFWAVVTIGTRVIDTLMLLGLFKWSDVYETPTGAILWANVVSEIVFANTFTLAALVGALMLWLCPKDVQA